tara:strand:+ start:86 stop:523 length:438 start_codon:yes stop_codon:yes gene_type:complete
MVLDTTHYNPQHKQIIDDLVGRPYTFFQKLKLGGIGSKRMIIDKVSPNMQNVMNTVSDINYGNIELRPNGILVMVTKGLKSYTWAIPYYHLVIYKINGSSIHAQGKFVHFRANKTFNENKKFFGKLYDQKVKYDMQYKMPDALWI